MNLNAEKRFLALFLAVLMVFSLVPISAIEVHAAADKTVDGLTVSHTDKGNDGGFTFEDNTLTVYDKSTSSTSCGKTTYTNYTTKVQLTNDTGADIKLTFTGLLENGGSATIGGENFTSGMSNDLANGGSLEIAVTSSDNNVNLTTLTLTISRKAADNVKTTFTPAENGSYTVDGTAITASKTITKTSAGTYNVVATPASGYQFFGWYSTAAGRYVSYNASVAALPSTVETTIYPVFISSTMAKFGVKGTDDQYFDLNEACTAAQAASSKTVVLLNNGTLPAGDYTIPAGVTLLIPYDSANTIHTTVPKQLTTTALPTAYLTLTMASGASLTVNGSLNVGGSQSGAYGYNGCVTGSVGMILMISGSTITLENSSFLYAWGYIYGSGSVVAKDGSTVYESFQLRDYRGGDDTSKMAQDKEHGTFPMSQYYIQNIEVPLYLYAGAKESAYMSTNVTLVGMQGGEVPVVSGTDGGAMFRISSGYIIKDYDEQSGRLKFELRGDVSVSTLKISMKLAILGSTTIDSSQFNLPIPGHMSVDAISGNVTIAQDMVFLPGSELYIRENVYCTLEKDTRIVVFDIDEWPWENGKGYCHATNVPYVELHYVVGGLKTSADRKKDALVQIDGTIDASAGAVYTTTGGANIYTTGSGVVITTPGNEIVTYQILQNIDANETDKYDEITITPAKLKNADGTYFETSEVDTATKAYVYDNENGVWICLDNDIYDHSYTSVETSPTCTAQGYTTHTCSVCGHSYKDTYVDPRHLYDDACDEKCDACGETRTPPHYDPPTDSNHDCDLCGTGNINEHVWKDTTYSWTDDGKRCTATRVCSVCGSDENEVADVSFDKVTFTVKTPASCTEDGWTTYTANFEAEWAVDGQTKDVQDIPATGHDYKAVVTAPTCTEAGYTTYTCSTCGDSYKDDEVVAIGHKDDDKNHVCDNGCDVYQGTHADSDTDHACDYGCSVAMGTCEDKDLDHDCDYGCTKVYGTCEDADKDHYCDYGAKGTIGIACRKKFGDHADSETDEDHVCDYGCGVDLEDCSDKTRDGDHNCDVCGKENITEHNYGNATCEAPATCSECGATTGEALGHIDENTDHICDRNCGKTDMGTHEDTGKDHKCDYGCSVAIGTCEDKDLDHDCDYGCTKYFGEHIDANTDHACDYGCSVAIGECKDGDKDHDCDYGCDKVYGTCEDKADDGDHVCDYGCKKVLSTCGDSDPKDHVCDTDSACTAYNTDNNACADADNDGDHVCDYGCGATLSTCGDSDTNHVCDTDSQCTAYSTGDNACADADNDGNHVCDYGCGAIKSTCGDSNPKDHVCDTDSACTVYGTGDNAHADGDDKNHLCDYGCGKQADEGCYDADNDDDHKCDECGADNVTEHSYNSVVTEPTCTADGYTTHTCSVCGDTYTDSATNKLGHSYESVVTDPTCTVGGYTTHTCSVCGDTYTDANTAANGHSYGDVTFVWNGDNTQCTASRGCIRCTNTETQTVDSTSEITTVATCTVAQVTTYTADFTVDWAADQTKPVEGEIAPDNHTEQCTYSDNEDGTTHTKTYPCCNVTISESHTYTNGNCVCLKVQTFTITWVNGDTTKTTTVAYGEKPEAPFEDSALTKDPDIDYHYSFAGWGEVVEAVGNATYTAVYSGTGHDYTSNCKECSVCHYNGDGSRAHKVGNPTCTEDAVCEVCKTVVTPAYGHLFTYDINKCSWSTDEDGNHVYHFVASCSREDNCHETDEITVTAVQQEEGYQAPTCTADGSANYVATITSDTEKSWVMNLISNGSGTVSAVFTIEKLGHSLTETAAQAAICTEEGTLGYWTCGRCSVVFEDEAATVPTTAEARKLNSLGHDWKCTETGAITCNRDGCTATTTENIDTAHTWVSEGETPATCTKPGEHAGRTCSVCGKAEGGGEIPALGHKYGDASYAWTKEGTEWICTATHSCTVCTDEEGHTETATATVSSKITTESTCTVMGSTTYTATFGVEWAKEQVKTEQDVELAAHTPDKGIITKSPFYKAEGERTFHCTKCNAVTGTEVVPATGVINISVLGDSITAFEDYSNGSAAINANSTLAGGRVWFPMTEREFDSEGNPIDKGTGEITEAEHIWIYKAAEQLGAEILVNNSWSGSAVHFWQYGAPGMWEDRVVQLHDNTGDNSGQEPDIIVVYMGTNDFKYTEKVNGTYAIMEDKSEFQAVLGSYEAVDFDALITDNGDGTFTYEDPANTMEAYAISFHKMQQRYPDSEIYVMTLLPFRAGIHQPDDFNEDIRQMAQHFNVHLVDIEDTGIEADEKSFEYLMEDWLHPNIKGMEVLANAFEAAVRENSGLFTSPYVDVTYNLDGVTAMEGTTRTVVAGEDFDANLKLKDTSLIMQVTVLRNGEDITESCMTEVDDPKFGGTMVNIHIDNVAEDDVIIITAKAHKHEYTSVVTAPTCTNGGYTTYTCACGDTYKANDVAASGHSYTLLSDKVAEEATCTENAKYYTKCENCGDVHTTETLEKENTKLGHSYTNKASANVASQATCTEPARNYVQCDRCDAVSTDKTVAVGEELGHSYAEAGYTWQYDAAHTAWICTAKRVCSTDSSHIETATATVTGEVTTAPTCTTKGWTTYTATFEVDWAAKQTKEVEDIAVKGHSYGKTTYEWTNGNGNCTAKRVCENDATHVETVEATVASVVKTPATCTTTGCTTYTATFVVDWATTQIEEVEDIAAKGHTEEEIPAVSATCTGTGLTAGVKCSVCDEILVKQETVDVLGHEMLKTDAKDATCTATGNNEYYTCDRCYGVFKDADGANETTVEAETIAALGHSMTATAAKAATCTEDGNNEYYTCVTCGNVFKDADGKTATTVAKETIPATGHDLSAVASKAASCTAIGWNAYEYCNKCDYTTYSELPALGHNMTKTAAKAATCTVTGNNEYYTCSRCNGVFKDALGNEATTVAAETISAIGHAYNDGEVTTEPTCTGSGVKTFTCQNDTSHTYTERIDPLGHAPEYVAATAPTCTEKGQKEHYKCSRDNCGVLFLDEAGTTTTIEAALVVAANGHAQEIIPAVPATCTETGLTAGVKCSVCNDVLVEQKEVPATGHADDDTDHVCDNGCGISQGVHEDKDLDHACDYGCNKTYGDHVDANTDHACDYGCKETIGTCEDKDLDHACDYGCNKTYGDHVDANTDHACDYGCNVAFGSCEDTDKDHACDYGCDKSFGTHADSATDTDHVCDYGCGAVLEDCSDVDTDKDHNCDICGKEDVTDHKHSTYGCDADYHWSVCACEAVIEETKAEHSFESGACICGLPEIEVECWSEASYEVSGRVVTVSYEFACKVGYLKGDSYVALEATENADGSYSFKAPAEAEKVLILVKGDANLDGIVTAADIARINAAVLGKTTLSAEMILAGDVSGDGKANEEDFEDIKADVLKTASLEWN